MIIPSLTVSILVVLIELFTRHRGIIFVSYGLIIPFLIFLPRIIVALDPRVKKTVRIEWIKKLEFLSFFIIIINAPASLILHDLGSQYDRFLHFGVAFCALIIFLLLSLPGIKIKGKEIKKAALLFYVFSVLFISLFLWEVSQYTIDQLFGTKLFFDVSQDIKTDFREDIFFGTCGLIIATIYLNYSLRKYLLTLK